MNPLRIVIVGGVAGGMSAATRARRVNESASIIVLERSGHVSFANCGLPYYLNRKIPSADKLLVTTPKSLKSRFNIDARVHHNVTAIDRAKKVIRGANLDTNDAFELPYDKLILAPGAEAILPPIEHVNLPNVFALRNVENTMAIDQYIEKNASTKCVVVGAGFIGLEIAESLKQRGLSVSMVEKVDHVLPPLDAELATPLHQELLANGINLKTGVGLASLVAANGIVKQVVLENGDQLDADLVIMAIGVKPNTQLASVAGLKIGESGCIAVDSFQRTSDPDIYAAGDATETMHRVTGKPSRIPLAGPANRQGRIAGQHAATGASEPAPSLLGTAIVQVFGATAAMTGLSSTQAQKLGVTTDAAWVYPVNHASYYPGAKNMRLKVIYDPKTLKILGAQCVGAEGVDKRIDVIATVIHFGGTLKDLVNLDLTYSPQYGSAKDPVHIAAMVGLNQANGLSPAIEQGDMAGKYVVDVRTPTEFSRGFIPGAVNIPVDDLRNRLGELPKDKPIALYCQVGLRGYVAQRILLQNGFTNVVNVKGGYSMMKK